MAVIPSRLQASPADQAARGYDAHHNALLRHGEVVGVVYPEDPGSLTKRFVEYQVLVTERGSKTAGTRLYQHCYLASDLAGLADQSFRTLRAGDRDSSKSGLGSKVLVLCVDAEMTNPVIVSGIRDERDTDRGRKERGHHLETEFNGVNLRVNDDGSWSVTMGGPTKADGTLDEARSAAPPGTVVEVQEDGSFEVRTPEREQYVRVDNSAGKVTVAGAGDVTIQADQIHVGRDASERAVLGDTLMDLWGELIDEIIQDSRPTPTGNTSGPPNNVAKYLALKLRFRTALSNFVTVGKDP